VFVRITRPMAAAANAASKDCLARARRLVADLHAPRPAIYWSDLLASLAVGMTAASIHFRAPFLSPLQLVAWGVAGVAMFRASLFMHEIVHFRRGTMRGFTVAWNLLFGIPFMMPSFLYEHHLLHHSARHYGTPRDGEYLPLGGGRAWMVAAFLAEIALLPVLAVLRFLVITPLSCTHPRLRRWALERCSPLVINPWHCREIPADAPRRLWAAIELLCFVQAVGLVMLPFVSEVRIGDRIVPLGWPLLAKLYLVALLALGLNHVRTLVAHRYRSDGETMSFAEQLDDSINVEGRTPLVALMFPVGLRYHALHHLFPSIPYHDLGIAHRRIMRSLPEWHAYRAATYPSFWAALGDLLASIRAAGAERLPAASRWFARLTGDRRTAVAQTSQAA
jgi:fatty acid desaturase